MIFFIDKIIEALFNIDTFLLGIDFIFIGNDFTFQLARDFVCHAIFLQRALGCRAADDERGARFIDQNIIYFIDNGVIQFTLHALFQVNHHVIPEVIKTELVICAVGNICQISFLASNRLEMFPQISFFSGVIAGVKQEGNTTLTTCGLLPLNTGHSHPQSMINRAHPVGMRFGQIIIDRHQVHSPT